MSKVVLSLRNITRSFIQGGITIDVLKGVSLNVSQGEIVGLLGQSGTGKSTLLQAAGLLEGGFGGEVMIAGRVCSGLSADQRAALRLQTLGFVYQFHHLLPDFTACENVLMPQLLRGVNPIDGMKRAIDLLVSMGLGARLDHRPAQLSGGEQQRVAVARALANEPTLILADEPTGNLDEATGRVVLASLIQLARARGAAALIATHNRELARTMDRVVVLKDGHILGESSGSGLALLL